MNSKLTKNEIKMNYESWMNIHVNEFHLLFESDIRDN
jgi:hypothetical protein